VNGHVKCVIHRKDGDATVLLRAWQAGDQGALNELMPLVHDELRRIARACMNGERRGHTLQATALVNEAYLRLVDLTRVDWQNRTHFLAMAARIMRRVLVDLARARQAGKRGGDAVRITFDEALVPSDSSVDVMALDDALCELAVLDERKCQVVELRFFGGLSVEETATALQVSTKTVARDWEFARAWLHQQMAR
jgi:RNA polymerase sigma factor (TIGR02999 family)